MTPPSDMADNVPMRRVIVGFTVLALLFAFWGSPFFHLHAAGTRDHHQGAAVEYDHEALIHAHLPAVVATRLTATLSDAEEHEKPLDIFTAIAPAAAAVALPFLAFVRVISMPPVASSARVFLPLSPRTHDPPSLPRLIPRAPPA